METEVNICKNSINNPSPIHLTRGRKLSYKSYEYVTVRTNVNYEKQYWIFYKFSIDNQRYINLPTYSLQHEQCWMFSLFNMWYKSFQPRINSCKCWHLNVCNRRNEKSKLYLIRSNLLKCPLFFAFRHPARSRWRKVEILDVDKRKHVLWRHISVNPLLIRWSLLCIKQ